MISHFLYEIFRMLLSSSSKQKSEFSWSSHARLLDWRELKIILHSHWCSAFYFRLKDGLMKKLISYEIHFYLIRFQVLIQMKKRSKKMHMPRLDYSMKLIKPQTFSVSLGILKYLFIREAWLQVDYLFKRGFKFWYGKGMALSSLRYIIL